MATIAADTSTGDPLESIVDDGKPRQKHRLPLSAQIAAGVIVLIVLAAVFAPFLTAYDPNHGALTDRLLPLGSPGHPLGTDGHGRDIVTRLLYGARPSLLAGLIPVAVAGSIGTALGLIAGLGSTAVRAGIMRTLDVFYAFPAVLLAIAIAAALGSGVSNSIIALSVVLIPPIARVAEAETERLRAADFVEAARVSGAGRLAISVRQVLPNIAPTVVVYSTTLIGLSIIYAAGLSFLGLGISPPDPEWGVMVSNLQQFIFVNPQLVLAPALVILVCSVAFNVLGDGLRSYLNVRSESL